MDGEFDRGKGLTSSDFFRALNGGCQPSGLIDSTSSVKLRSLIGAADHIDREALGSQRFGQGVVRDLTGTDYDVVDFEYLGLSSDRQVQTLIVDTLVRAFCEHTDAAFLQAGPMDPPGGFAEARTQFSWLSLAQGDLPRRGAGLGQPTA